MRWWSFLAPVLAAFASVSCGSEDPVAVDPSSTTQTPGPTTQTLGPTTQSPSATVVVRRSMSDAEWDRIDDDGKGGVLDCPKYGESTWEYGAIGPSEPRGRTPDDALLDAARALKLPDRGWVDLTRSDKHYFVHDATSWHQRALTCDPAS